MVEKRTILSMIAAVVVIGAVASSAAPKPAGPLEGNVNSNELARAAPQKSTGAPSMAANSRQKRIAVGEEYVRHLLLLMDTDKEGKVSKQEFLSFMEAEFDRLDTHHDGKLEVKELAKTRVRPHPGK
jgi:Ca2+-binding EF-hand superfamily protein